ncbi:DUF1269 domain-containing protein [Pedobacter gandavensis]|uniref:DUF1269 domain-containing protein n=1 Tax=Pedobacter gandavensis TaxID=2679963 RepID=A0ABR6EVR6_9SPHI|nr:DUF1269 domain-containing protein [Pedobacter gandavensis]MBB2149350.1 DUF1269 domain-containing protein [Pedobacter gandavensis]
MEKMIQALFNTEVEAFKGLKALQELNLTHDISVGETYILTRDEDGKVNIRSAKNESAGNGALTGGVIGGLIGLLAGPLGFIVGLAGGIIAGSAGETLKAEGVSDYLDQISTNIPDGKSVLIAHVWESWETPVDALLGPLSVELKRFNLDEKVFVPAKTELDKLQSDIEVAEAKLKEVGESEKADWENTLANLKAKRAALEDKLKTHHAHQEKQYEEWISQSPAEQQVEDAEKQARLENRIKKQKTRLDELKKDK